jgi:hypothetical protein
LLSDLIIFSILLAGSPANISAGSRLSSNANCSGLALGG